jgi:hypothetical protein
MRSQRAFVNPDVDSFAVVNLFVIVVGENRSAAAVAIRQHAARYSKLSIIPEIEAALPPHCTRFFNHKDGGHHSGLIWLPAAGVVICCAKITVPR